MGATTMPTVLVTGAGRGLGLELARQYAAEGWQVIGTVRDPARAGALVQLAAAQPQQVRIETMDVADHASIDALAQRLRSSSGAAQPIDVLVNSAGTMGSGNFAQQGIAFGRFGKSDFSDWEMVFRVNVIGPMKMAEAFVEHVAASEQRRLVALSSIIGSIARNEIGGLYAYRASKAALNAVMRSLAIDLGRKYKILVAPIHPGWVRTDMGGPRADLDPATSVAGIRKVIDGLDADKAGRFWMYDGTELPW
jgi:NAD(P)-dependent dehydrogenase (short-subunit alcohol dehydrogenase family)